MTALVTGANGFVGAAVVRQLLERGWPVRAMVRPGSDRRNLEGLDVELVEADLLDPASLRWALEGARALFHVAADYRLWVPDPEPMFRANVEGTRALMMAALAAETPRIVYTSSVAVLGLHPDGTPADETTPSSEADMTGPYKRSKFQAEAAVRRLIAEHGLPAVIVNPSTPVGPGDLKPTPTGKLIVEAASGRMPAFVDTGLNIVHVDDVARGHWLAFERGEVGERYILGSENLTLARILAIIAGIVGRRAPRVRLPHAAVMSLARAAERWSRTFGGEPFATVDGVEMAKKIMHFTSAKAESDLGYHARPAADALTDAVAGLRRAGMLA